MILFEKDEAQQKIKSYALCFSKLRIGEDFRARFFWWDSEIEC